MSDRSMGLTEEGTKTIRQALFLYRHHLLAQEGRRQQNAEPAAASEGVAGDDIHKDQLHIVDTLLESFTESLPPAKDEFDPLRYPALHELEAQPTASPFSDHWILPDPGHSTASSKPTSISEDWGLVEPTGSGSSTEAIRLASVHSSNGPTALLDSVATSETHAHPHVMPSNGSEMRRKPVPDWSSQPLSSHHSQHIMPQLPKSVARQCPCSSSPCTHDAPSSHAHSRSLIPTPHCQQSSRIQSISQAATQLGPQEDASAYSHVPRSAGVYTHSNATVSLGGGLDDNINTSPRLPTQSHCCGCCFGSPAMTQTQPPRGEGCHSRIESRPMPNGRRNQNPGYVAYRPFHRRVEQQSQPENPGIPILRDPVTEWHPLKPESAPTPASDRCGEGRAWLGSERLPYPSNNPAPTPSMAMPASPRLREQVTFNPAVLSAWNRPPQTDESTDPVEPRALHGMGSVISDHPSDTAAGLQMGAFQQSEQKSPSRPLGLPDSLGLPHGGLDNSFGVADGLAAHSRLELEAEGDANVLNHGHQQIPNNSGNAPSRPYLSITDRGTLLHGGKAENESMRPRICGATYIPGHLEPSKAPTTATLDQSSHPARPTGDRALKHGGPSSDVLRPSGFAPLKQHDSVFWPSTALRSTSAADAPQTASCEVTPNNLRPKKSRIQATREVLPTLPATPLPTICGSGRRQDRHSLTETGSASPRAASPPTVSDEDLAALQKLQDKFNHDDETALANQEAFARQIQDQLNGSPALDSNAFRTRSQRKAFLSGLATDSDQNYGATGLSHNRSSSGAQSPPSYAARNAIEFAPGACDDETVQHLVVVKQPTITNANSSRVKRQSSAGAPDTALPTIAAAQEIAKYAAAQRVQQDVAKEAARKKPVATKATHASDKVACAACDDKDTPSALASLQCGHHYCGICIADAFKHALSAGKVFICCNKTPVPVAVAARFLPAECVTQYKTKLEERTTANPVYCAKPGCSAFIAPRNLKGPLATCEKCGFVSCSLCKNPEHKGVCPPDKLGLKLMNLAGNRNWVQCTRCKAIVERDDGCLHMTCTCGYEFCYSCGGPWDLCGASCPRKA